LVLHELPLRVAVNGVCATVPEVPVPFHNRTVTVLAAELPVVAVPENAGVVTFVRDPLAGALIVTAHAGLATTSAAAMAATMPPRHLRILFGIRSV
jgi:hypothetical protein